MPQNKILSRALITANAYWHSLRAIFQTHHHRHHQHLRSHHLNIFSNDDADDDDGKQNAVTEIPGNDTINFRFNFSEYRLNESDGLRINLSYKSLYWKHLQPFYRQPNDISPHYFCDKKISRSIRKGAVHSILWIWFFFVGFRSYYCAALRFSSIKY
uniref:Uncharacterized protein n=1 Tax=Glossina brevipalpis TaxID=37001 RepID=A0A1A9WFK8_9MUSC